MITRIAPVLIAASVTLSVGITPAASYYRPVNPETIQRHSPRSGASSNSTSSSSGTTVVRKLVRSVPSEKTSFQTPTTAKERAACLQAAAQKREDAIRKSLDDFYAVMGRMLDLRSDLIVKYWGMTDVKKRDMNMRMVWRSFGSAWRNHGRAMKDLRRDAWDTFRTERSLCGVYGKSDPEAGGLAADAQF